MNASATRFEQAAELRASEKRPITMQSGRLPRSPTFALQERNRIDEGQVPRVVPVRAGQTNCEWHAAPRRKSDDACCRAWPARWDSARSDHRRTRRGWNNCPRPPATNPSGRHARANLGARSGSDPTRRSADRWASPREPSPLRPDPGQRVRHRPIVCRRRRRAIPRSRSCGVFRQGRCPRQPAQRDGGRWGCPHGLTIHGSRAGAVPVEWDRSFPFRAVDQRRSMARNARSPLAAAPYSASPSAHADRVQPGGLRGSDRIMTTSC